jgi:hypothetical protein
MVPEDGLQTISEVITLVTLYIHKFAAGTCFPGPLLATSLSSGSTTPAFRCGGGGTDIHKAR